MEIRWSNHLLSMEKMEPKWRLCIFATLCFLSLECYLCSEEFKGLGVSHYTELKSSLQIATFIWQGRGSQQDYMQECIKVWRIESRFMPGLLSWSLKYYHPCNRVGKLLNKTQQYCNCRGSFRKDYKSEKIIVHITLFLWQKKPRGL